MDWLADTGSWASIASLPFTLVSFGISIYVAVRIRDIRQRLLFMVMADRRLMRQICADIARFRRSVFPETDKVAEGLTRLQRRFEKISGSSLRQDEEEKAELILKMLNEMMVFVSHSADDVEDRRVGGSEHES